MKLNLGGEWVHGGNYQRDSLETYSSGYGITQ